MNSDLERVLLGTLILKPDFIQLSDPDQLNSRLFSSGRARKTFEEISSIWEHERPREISSPVLAERLGGNGSATFVGSLLEGLQRPSFELFQSNVDELAGIRAGERIIAKSLRAIEEKKKSGSWDWDAIEKIVGEFGAIKNPDKASSGPILRVLADIEPKPVEWTWPNRIPRGKLTLIVGDPCMGKSYFCVDLAARVSRGREWPDIRGFATLGSVLMLTAEDGLADTVRIRADASGADVSRLIVLEGVREKGETRSFNLAEHIPILERVIHDRPDLSMIIIDPISAYLGDLDSHKNAEVRGALAPLSALAEKSNVAMVCVSHLNKSTASDRAIYRIQGSLSFVAAARACWGVVMDPEDPCEERRLIVPVKANLSVQPLSLAFKIDPAGRLVYESGSVKVNVDEAIGAKREDQEQRTISEGWLRDILQGGPMDVKEIMSQASAEKIPSSSIYRACNRLGIIKQRSGAGTMHKSTWELKR